jgi:hypothetical protein
MNARDECERRGSQARRKPSLTVGLPPRSYLALLFFTRLIVPRQFFTPQRQPFVSG